ncbi:MAG: long-chain fatty acid--CoA ligase, partial [Alphaproteobacteria bacterium]|nr:long-chain fatty acid--CoA ligase [Alphaproteobacteria bacterium]
HRRFDPTGTLTALVADKPTLTVLVPTQFLALMADARWTRERVASLRSISTGSTIVAKSLVDKIQALGVPVIQIYGSTETAPIAAYQRREDAFRKPGSTGKAGLHSELRIVDDAGRDVAQGASGEIVVRGGHVMTGYWNDAAATAAALQDGWFRTGDIGYFDADGDLWVNDRKKDMIVSGGENIYPAEIEAVLAEHPAIAESAVVGRKDEYWGEIAVAVVAARPGHNLDAAGVLSFCAGRLARYKHPREVVVVPALPRNAMGKVIKDELRRGLRARTPETAGA